jgi:hypothetical protein
MKKICTVLVLIFSPFFLLFGQDTYKQNILELLKKVPEIKSGEACYNLFKCKDNSCSAYKSTMENLSKAFKGITDAELAVSTAMTSNVQPTSMTSEQADALAAKLSKMTDAEKQQWAMQNAQTFMNPMAAHANQDADNTVVNDAVEYVTRQQREDMKDVLKPSDVPAQFQTIEDKYKTQRTTLLNTFHTASGTDYDPSSPHPYVFGEASKAEVAKFDKAYNDYKLNITAINNAELNAKLAHLKKVAEGWISKYSITEGKLAATHYGDDAQENMNKNHLLMAQHTILSKVMENFGNCEDVVLDYANRYADLQKIERVKTFDGVEK